MGQEIKKIKFNDSTLSVSGRTCDTGEEMVDDSDPFSIGLMLSIPLWHVADAGEKPMESCSPSWTHVSPTDMQCWVIPRPAGSMS